MSTSEYFQSSSDLTSTGYETAQSNTSSQENTSRNQNVRGHENNSAAAKDNTSLVSAETLQQVQASSTSAQNPNKVQHDLNYAPQSPEIRTISASTPSKLHSAIPSPKSYKNSAKSPSNNTSADTRFSPDFDTPKKTKSETENTRLAFGNLSGNLPAENLSQMQNKAITPTNTSLTDHGTPSFSKDGHGHGENGSSFEVDPEPVELSSLDWDSEHDKDNPKNWSSAKKWFITMTTACICLSVTCGSSLYVCGVPDLMLKMGASQTLALSGLTFYLVGLAFGPAISAPLSELFGRKVVYCSSLPVSMLFTMGVGLSDKIRNILVFRFFSGLFASPAMAVAGGTISDIWDFEMMGLAMAGFCLAPFMGPVLGPIIGGFVAEKKGWKWTMWVMLFMAGTVLIPTLFCPETYKPIILKKRAKKRGIKIAKSHTSLSHLLKFIFTVNLVTPLKMLVVEPIVLVFSIYIAFIFAVLFGFFEAYPLIFRGVYKMTLGKSGLTFLGICVGFLLGAALYVILDRAIFFKKNPDGTRGARDENGNLILHSPESTLVFCKIGAVVLPPALFWIGWTAREDVHWISPCLAGVPFGFGLILIFFSTMIYFSMTFPPLSLASAIAANNLLRCLLASVFPLFVIQMYKKLGIDWASSLFGFVALGLLPVPWIFEKWGPALRKRSVYGYAAVMQKAAQAKEMERLKQEQEQSEKLHTDETHSSDGMMNSNSC